MMTDLAATINTARANLRKLWEAWDHAFAINLDYGPGAWKADGMPVHRGDPAENSPIRCQSGACDCGETEWPTGGHDRDCGRRPSTTALSAAYDASVRQLAAALVPASEITGIDDGVSQGSVLPHNQSHIPLATAQSIARLVNYSLITVASVVTPYWHYYAIHGTHGPQRRWVVPDDLTPEDDRWIREVCALVLAALMKLPDDLTIHAKGRVTHPTEKRCHGGPGRSTCTSYVPWSTDPGYCKLCTQRFENLFAEHPGHRDEPCRNPWGRTACAGTVNVPKYSLCAHCDQFRRNVIRQAAA